jgi:cell division protein FtsN
MHLVKLKLSLNNILQPKHDKTKISSRVVVLVTTLLLVLVVVVVYLITSQYQEAALKLQNCTQNSETLPVPYEKYAATRHASSVSSRNCS